MPTREQKRFWCDAWRALADDGRVDAFGSRECCRCWRMWLSAGAPMDRLPDRMVRTANFSVQDFLDGRPW